MAAGRGGSVELCVASGAERVEFRGERVAHALQTVDLDCQAASLGGGLVCPRADGISYAAEGTAYEAVVLVIIDVVIAVTCGCS